MKEYFDTPVLVFACHQSAFSREARERIAGCGEPISTPHALAECFNTLTYRLQFPPDQAREVMRHNLARFQFVAMDADDYRAAIDRVVDGGLTGDKIYDALHVGAAIKGKASKIHTSNKRDFGPLTPADIQVDRIGP
jgi:predicted nucleic acid-binding protein